METYIDRDEFILELPVKLSAVRLSHEEAGILKARLDQYLTAQADHDRETVQRAKAKLEQLRGNEFKADSNRNAYVKALAFVLGEVGW